MNHCLINMFNMSICYIFHKKEYFIVVHSSNQKKPKPNLLNWFSQVQSEVQPNG